MHLDLRGRGDRRSAELPIGEGLVAREPRAMDADPFLRLEVDREEEAVSLRMSMRTCNVSETRFAYEARNLSQVHTSKL